MNNINPYLKAYAKAFLKASINTFVKGFTKASANPFVKDFIFGFDRWDIYHRSRIPIDSDRVRISVRQDRRFGSGLLQV